MLHKGRKEEREGVATPSLGCTRSFTVESASVFAREKCPSVTGLWSRGNSGTTQSVDVSAEQTEKVKLR